MIRVVFISYYLSALILCRHLHTELMVCEVSTDNDSAMNRRSFLLRKRNTGLSLQESEALGWIPQYVRTRRVTLLEVNIDSKQCVVCTCSCTSFHHKLVLCRHVFAILSRPPNNFDVFPECRKDYAVWYGDKQQPRFNANVDKRTKLLEHFGGMIYEGTLDDNIRIHSSQLLKYDDDNFGLLLIIIHVGRPSGRPAVVGDHLILLPVLLLQLRGRRIRPQERNFTHVSLKDRHTCNYGSCLNTSVIWP